MRSQRYRDRPGTMPGAAGSRRRRNLSDARVLGGETKQLSLAHDHASRRRWPRIGGNEIERNVGSTMVVKWSSQRRSSKRRCRSPTDSGFVFTGPEGKPPDDAAFSKQFHRLLNNAGLARRRFHDLRPSFATLLVVQRVSPRVVMDVPGHSQIG